MFLGCEAAASDLVFMIIRWIFGYSWLMFNYESEFVFLFLNFLGKISDDIVLCWWGWSFLCFLGI